MQETQEFNPWVGKIPWRRKWQPTPVFLPGEFHRQRSLGGLQSMGSQRVGHDWSDLTHMHAVSLGHQKTRIPNDFPSQSHSAWFSSSLRPWGHCSKGCAFASGNFNKRRNINSCFQCFSLRKGKTSAWSSTVPRDVCSWMPAELWVTILVV